jgi:hypothetical protein
LGTDELGRDMLTRLMVGAKLSLFMGITPVVCAFFIGSLIGITAGYTGGWVNSVMMRTIDVFYAFPSVLLAIALSGALGAGITNSLISLTIVFIPPLARVAESVTTQIRERRSGQGIGCIRFHHRAGACAGQCAGADFCVRHEFDRGVHDLGLGSELFGSGGETPRAGMGPDAQHLAHRHLFATLDCGFAWCDDFHDIDCFQPFGRRLAFGHGNQTVRSA